MRLSPDLRRVIAALHAHPARIVYAFAGAGSLALTWLHAVPGSSRTILAAWDAYAPRALARCTAPQPAQPAVSAATAQAMAGWARRTARELADEPWPLLGVAVTAALRTDRVRRSADRAFIAIDDGASCRLRCLDLQHERRTRLQQEHAVSLALLMAVADGFGENAPLPALFRGDVLSAAWLVPAAAESL